MPFATACPKCNKKYNVPDSLLGKAVKCQQCGASFKAVALNANQAAGPAPLSQQQMTQFGIEGDFESSPEIFSAEATSGVSNIGNFAQEDPGFGGEELDLSVADVDPQDDNPYAAVLKNRAVDIAGSKKKRGKGGQIQDAEGIRLMHLGHESVVKQFGQLNVINGVIMIVVGLVAAGFVFLVDFSIPDEPEVDLTFLKTFFLIAIGCYMFGGLIGIIIGQGMVHLSPVGRIGGTITYGLGLLAFPFGTALGVWMLIIFWGPQSEMLFSDKYKKVIAQTRHISYTPWILYVFGFLMFFSLLGPFAILIAQLMGAGG